jgi:hypothetical protein
MLFDLEPAVSRRWETLTAAGIAFGLPGGTFLRKLFTSHPHEVCAADPLTIVMVVLPPGVVALLAGFRAASRATRIGPANARHAE